MPFSLLPTAIPEVLLLQPQAFADERGLFMEVFKASQFAALGLGGPWVQDNLSVSAQGVLRGLHYQKNPYAQGKLVSCLRGAIFDVAVDLRRGSPTYGQWVGVELSQQNQRMLWVPPGFAHGFQALQESSLVFYKVTAEWAAGQEAGVRYNDPDLAIAWPIANPLLSAKDQALPGLAQADHDFVYG